MVVVCLRGIVVVDWRKEGGGSVGVAGGDRLLCRYNLIDCYVHDVFYYTISECTISNFLDSISIPHANTSFPERWHCSLKQIVSERT